MHCLLYIFIAINFLATKSIIYRHEKCITDKHSLAEKLVTLVSSAATGECPLVYHVCA